MDRNTWSRLLAELDTHRPADEKEAADVAFVRAFIVEHPADAHLRAQPLGHLTGSGFILDASRERVLLLHHRRLDRWLQPGGHGEGETDPRAIALREIEEETGLSAGDLTAFPDERLLDVDVHRIPARPGEPEHPHLDLRYGFTTDVVARARVSDESRALGWFPVNDLPDGCDAALRRAVRKLGGTPPYR